MINLVAKLKKLKSLGASAVKQSLEDEGASFEDIKKMKNLTSKVGLDLNVKIGGCEAKNDIFFCKRIGVNGIVSPMIESKYALNKFIQTVKKDKKTSLYINLESDLAFKNVREIINSKHFKSLRGIVIGRSDLAGSLGLTKKEVDSKKIYKKVHKVLSSIKKKKKNIVCKMGGSLTYKSKNFIELLFKKKLINRIETRNVEILLSKRTISNLKQLIFLAFDFEMEWIKNKLRHQKHKNKVIVNDYSSRIKEIKNRLKKQDKIND